MCQKQGTVFLKMQNSYGLFEKPFPVKISVWRRDIFKKIYCVTVLPYITYNVPVSGTVCMD
jgi:hypothetical protein